LFQDK